MLLETETFDGRLEWPFARAETFGELLDAREFVLECALRLASDGDGVTVFSWFVFESESCSSSSSSS